MEARTLTIFVDVTPGSRCSHPDAEGLHPVYDTPTKRYRRLNFVQHECYLDVRVPQVRLPDTSVRLVELSWAEKLSGVVLLCEALVVTLCQQMPFDVCARLGYERSHRVAAICARYVNLGLANCSGVRTLAMDETSQRSGHQYGTLAADAE